MSRAKDYKQSGCSHCRHAGYVTVQDIWDLLPEGHIVIVVDGRTPVHMHSPIENRRVLSVSAVLDSDKDLCLEIKI